MYAVCLTQSSKTDILSVSAFNRLLYYIHTKGGNDNLGLYHSTGFEKLNAFLRSDKHRATRYFQATHRILGLVQKYSKILENTLDDCVITRVSKGRTNSNCNVSPTNLFLRIAGYHYKCSRLRVIITLMCSFFPYHL